MAGIGARDALPDQLDLAAEVELRPGLIRSYRRAAGQDCGGNAGAVTQRQHAFGGYVPELACENCLLFRQWNHLNVAGDDNLHSVGLGKIQLDALCDNLSQIHGADPSVLRELHRPLLACFPANDGENDR